MEAGSVEKNSLTENYRLPIQNYFIGWQCRVRELALRNEEGRPNGGMRPQIVLKNGEVVFPAATLLIIPEQPEQIIRQFRYMALKTQDPKERYTKAMQMLAARFYQKSEDFSGAMAGIFSQFSEEVMALEKDDYCIMEFDYQQQAFKIPCNVSESPKNDQVHEFTYWHNYLFNPNLSPEVKVLHFKPDWSETLSEPTPI